MDTLYLGTHCPTWLTIDGPPLMVSLNRVPSVKKYSAVVPWFLDSGGFTELQQHGRWRRSAAEFMDRVCNVVERFGMVEWLSPQDWMCEPAVIAGGTYKGMTFAGTGLSVREHQHLTVQNYLDLIDMAPNMDWVPVLQGYSVDEYHYCADLYYSAGVDLAMNGRVGVGSVCRRESMPEAVEIMRTLSERGYQLHGFGFKQSGIAACWPYLRSADSMAWSYNARADGRSCGRSNGRGGAVKTCGNCRHYALDWHQRTLSKKAPFQHSLF